MPLSRRGYGFFFVRRDILFRVSRIVPTHSRLEILINPDFHDRGGGGRTVHHNIVGIL